MPDAQLDTVLRHVRQLALPPHTRALSDAQLLERFRAAGEEAAFAALMQRHGSLVWGVCRHILSNAQDAEDAFQAAFLVLARKAGSIRQGEAVAGFLHGTAYRVAMRARRDALRRRRREDRLEPPSGRTAASEGAWRELQAALDEEVQALPERQRAVFVLCVLEGKKQAEAAVELGWKEGTVAGTLARARKRLREQLARRDVSLSALLAGKVLAEPAGGAPAVLTEATLRAALGTTLVSPTVNALVHGVTDAMLPAKLKSLTVLLLMLTLLAGTAAFARRAAPPPRAEPQREQAPAAREGLDDPLPPGAVGRLGTLRFRHDGDVNTFALSSDGKTLATASGRVVVLWDSATGKELRRLEGHTGTVHSLAFTDDGRTVASGGEDSFIRLWDTESGKERRRIEVRMPRRQQPLPTGVYRLLFTPDGKSLVARSADATVRVWNASTGKETGKISDLPGWAMALALSPDGKTIAAPVGDPLKGKGEVRLWETATLKELRRLPLTGTVTCVAFHPDGKSLAIGVGSAGWDKPSSVVLYEIETETKVRTLAGHKQWVTALAFSADGKKLFSGSYDATPRLWDVSTGKELARISNGRMPVYGAAFCPDGRTLLLLTGNVGDHTVRFRCNGECQVPS